MVSGLISRGVILVFGTLYPAYASYKAVKTKNVKEYVKWMMYWIVFAFFTTLETFADLFIAWLPFYYELKILFVLWLLSPATKGASIVYRKIVHPQLSKREKDIDSYISKASDQGYSALLSLGSRGFNYVTNVAVSTALKGQATVIDQLKKSYSLNDLSQSSSQGQLVHVVDDNEVDMEDETDNRIIEESFRHEMMTRAERKQLESNKNYDNRDRFAYTNPNDPDLMEADEEDETEEDTEPVKPKKKEKYSTKEAKTSKPVLSEIKAHKDSGNPPTSPKRRSSQNMERKLSNISDFEELDLEINNSDDIDSNQSSEENPTWQNFFGK